MCPKVVEWNIFEILNVGNPFNYMLRIVKMAKWGKGLNCKLLSSEFKVPHAHEVGPYIHTWSRSNQVTGGFVCRAEGLKSDSRPRRT